MTGMMSGLFEDPVIYGTELSADMAYTMIGNYLRSPRVELIIMAFTVM